MEEGKKRKRKRGRRKREKEKRERRKGKRQGIKVEIQNCKGENGKKMSKGLFFSFFFLLVTFENH